MTQDEIIEMAKQTHLPYFWETGVPCNLSGLEEFAKLVAAKEREACAKVCDELQDVPATEPRHCAEDIRARGEA
jgi:hypothetical protein